ncbi:glucuronate isomerase [Oceanobacillus jeddahense]|uniref:Uronate isomerase n=1 Tax=Oceanobacillus jeddahense TaxID=1462527 RepID=A0ABY5JRY6_9BACI|nr:glucuronate isomerase [Oceanobacillus jeddahense]UUI03092.1 glucuronate isomerase [Oceanobacillus jeddahense]
MALITENFLLTTNKAKELYQSIKDIPIFDFHCHLSPKEIYEDKNFTTITDLWLGHDHYKWRLMRAFGIDEKLITGDGDNFEKFKAFIEMLPKAIMNPMYHWCYLELARYFDHFEGVQHSDPKELYQKLNEKLAQPDMSPRNLLRKSNVQVVCTTDDPCDDLRYHQELAKDKSFEIEVRPTFRPDFYISLKQENIETAIQKLHEATGLEINHLSDYIQALENRVDYFNEHGAKSADQSFSEVVLTGLSEEKAAAYFTDVKNGKALDNEKTQELAGYLLSQLAKSYKKYDWVMQLHLGPLRNNNTRQFEKIGTDAGFDSLGNLLNAEALNQLLDHLNQNDALTNTIIYPHNANDHQMVQATAGNFTSKDVKVQLGAAWWYNDTKDGMTQHLIDYANIGLLSEFAGMLTDSRSLVSYSRHEYFRRILCQLIGSLVEQSEIEDDPALLEGILKDICFNNAARLFKVENIKEVH